MDITQSELADLAGVSRSTIQAIEYGRESVRLGALVDVGDVLGLDFSMRVRGGRS